LALRYLPTEHSPAVFAIMQQKITSNGNVALQQLADYIQDTWINSKIFPPLSWSSYNRVIRTNNDVEGWHNRFRSKCTSPSLNLYVLVARLFKEATFVPLQCALLSEGLLRRTQRSGQVRRNKTLFDAWDLYDTGQITVNELFTKVAYCD
jgi:hypothetical protein